MKFDSSEEQLVPDQPQPDAAQEPRRTPSTTPKRSAQQATAPVPRHLPAQLINARAMVRDILRFLDLTPLGRQVLFGILTFVRIEEPGNAIFPRRDTLRMESHIGSDATLYRGQQQVEEKGYITREQIRKTKSGRYHISRITLTGKALAMLGLAPDIHNPRSLNLRGRHIRNIPIGNSLTDTPAPRARDENSIDRKTRLPVELLPLLAQGVAAPRICLLMREASKKGKRLGDIYRTVEHSLRGLSPNEIFAYLLGMISKDLDFAFLAKQKTEKQLEQTRDAAARRKLAWMHANCGGYLVRDTQTGFEGIYEAGANGDYVVGSGASLAVNRLFADAVLDGRYRLTPPSALDTDFICVFDI